MKRCPFCAEEIQDAAIVCKHCGRDLAPVPPVGRVANEAPPKAKRTVRSILVGLGILTLSVIMAVVTLQREFPRTPTFYEPSKILSITAAKTSQSVSFTNREPSNLTECRVTLLDQGDAEWLAYVPGTIAPSQTVTVRWGEFRSNNQPMPAYIGQNRDNFIVSCFVGNGGNRRSAGLHF